MSYRFKTTHLLTFLLVFSFNTTTAQIPSDPLIELRADSGVTVDGGVVTRWADLGQNGHDATPPLAGPIFVPVSEEHGNPTVAFDGSNYLKFPNIFPVASDYTKVTVVRILNPAFSNNILSGTSVHAFWTAGSLFPGMFHRGRFVTSRRQIDSGVTFIMIGTFEQARLRGALYVNGEFMGAGITPNANTDSTLHIGAFNGGSRLVGEVSEVLVYDRIITDEERATLEDHLLAKYGIDSWRDTTTFPFAAFPAQMQLYPRDEDDSARVAISGVVEERGWDSLVIETRRNGEFWKREGRELEYTGQKGALFSLAPTIYADTVEFGFEVSLRKVSGEKRVVGTRESILCGDVLMVTGQSNSIFGNAGATWTSRYARSFGSNTGYTRYEESDTVWGLSRANAGGGPMVVGVWGLEIQRHILENQGIPTALVNGGVGGSRIEQNLRNGADNEDLTTIYGRTLYRVRHAGIDSTVRALYWYQGESNSDAGYYDNFRNLYASWVEDYPSLEKIYVVQIRPGCAINNRHSELRELLRTLPDSFRNDPVPIVAYAPTAAPGHDGCHYALDGYLVIGQQLYNLTARDLYGSTDTMNIASPTVVRARYGTKDRQTIILDFGPEATDLIWQGGLVVGESLRLLRDAFSLDTLSEQVIAGSARGNRVTLYLVEPSSAATISYVPEDYYPGTTTIYQGPWLMNERGVGAFSFAGVPIREYDPSSVTNTLLPDESITARWRNDGSTIEVSTNLRHSGELTLRVYNALGRLIGEKSDREVKGVGLHRIEIGEVARQELFVVVERGGVEFVVRVEI